MLCYPHGSGELDQCPWLPPNQFTPLSARQRESCTALFPRLCVSRSRWPGQLLVSTVRFSRFWRLQGAIRFPDREAQIGCQDVGNTASADESHAEITQYRALSQIAKAASCYHYEKVVGAVISVLCVYPGRNCVYVHHFFRCVPHLSGSVVESVSAEETGAAGVWCCGGKER
jgi:hypothetical protein